MALVTGASRGVGLCIARMLADEGFALTITSRTTSRLNAAASSLRAVMPVMAVPADLARDDDIRRLVHAHSERYRRLDLLVNNAGLARTSLLRDTSTGALDYQLAVNVRAPYLLTRDLFPLLRDAAAAGQSRIINISSLSGEPGTAVLGQAGYALSKAALTRLGQIAALELAGAGIAVTTIISGPVATDMLRLAPDTAKSMALAPTDVAAVVRCVLHTPSTCVVSELHLHPHNAGTIAEVAKAST